MFLFRLMIKIPPGHLLGVSTADVSRFSCGKEHFFFPFEGRAGVNPPILPITGVSHASLKH